jgi:hypothetical protein
MAPMRPRRPRRSLFLVLALAGACSLPGPARASEADDLYAKGNAAFEASNFDEAYKLFLAAWKLSQSFDVAANLGQVEIQLGKHRDAAEHLSYSLAHFPLGGDADVRKATEEAFAEAKKSVSVVRIKVSAKDAVITLDGAVIDPKANGGELFVTAGKHAVEATAPGYRLMRRPFEARAGGDEDVIMALVVETSPGRSPAPAFVLGGVGLIGVVLGAVLVGSAEGKKSEAIKLHDEIGTVDGCTAQAAKCKSLHDATSGTDALGNAGVAAFVFGGVAGAAAGLYLVLPSRKPAAAAPATSPSPAPAKPPAKTGLFVTPYAGASSGGVVVSGSF